MLALAVAREKLRNLAEPRRSSEVAAIEAQVREWSVPMPSLARSGAGDGKVLICVAMLWLPVSRMAHGDGDCARGSPA